MHIQILLKVKHNVCGDRSGLTHKTGKTVVDMKTNRDFVTMDSK